MPRLITDVGEVMRTFDRFDKQLKELEDAITVLESQAVHNKLLEQPLKLLRNRYQEVKRERKEYGKQKVEVEY